MKKTDYLNQPLFTSQTTDPLHQYAVLLLSTFPSRECGIATFSKDLRESIQDKFHHSVQIDVCAIDHSNSVIHYPDSVRYVLRSDQEESYLALAREINQSNQYDCILLEHEFGLFQGDYGSFLCVFLNEITIPVLTTFHTVLPNPSAKRKEIVTQIIALSKAIICMTNASGAILEDAYDCPAEKITIIPHGTHLLRFKSPEKLKEKFGLTGRKTLSTFGLLSSGKSIETGLHAVAEACKSHPEILYLIIGKTHPEIVKQEGEQYRNYLKSIISDLGIASHVQFVNEFLDRQTLQEYLQATDIYLFTSTDPHQAVSGTFSYAMGCGCPIISTRIPQAKDMLGQAGLLVDFKDTEQMAEAIQSILNDENRLAHMKRSALQQIRPSAWQNVAIQHMKLIEKHSSKKIKSLKFSIPPYNLAHFFQTTNDRGMVQFCQGEIPHQASGYTLDDNTRALMGLMEYYELTGDNSVLRLIDVYFKFICDMQQANGRFLNYLDQDGQVSQQNFEEDLNDANGRAIWAIGTMMSKHPIFDDQYFPTIRKLMLKSLPQIKSMESPRSIAFCIKGLLKYNEIFRNEEIDQLVWTLGKKLTKLYHRHKIKSHHWFEPTLTYANAVIPEALLLASRKSGDEKFQHIAKESFDYLCSILFEPSHFRVISNQTWHIPGANNSKVGEQPIDVAYTVLALSSFHETFGFKRYLIQMKIAFEWYLGKNQLDQIVYNPISGGCLDGIEATQVNMNQGAEATSTYLMARNCLEKHQQKEQQFIQLFSNQNQPYIKKTNYAQNRNFQSTKSECIQK